MRHNNLGCVPAAASSTRRRTMPAVHLPTDGANLHSCRSTAQHKRNTLPAQGKSDFKAISIELMKLEKLMIFKGGAPPSWRISNTPSAGSLVPLITSEEKEGLVAQCHEAEVMQGAHGIRLFEQLEHQWGPLLRQCLGLCRRLHRQGEGEMTLYAVTDWDSHHRTSFRAGCPRRGRAPRRRRASCRRCASAPRCWHGGRFAFVMTSPPFTAIIGMAVARGYGSAQADAPQGYYHTILIRSDGWTRYCLIAGSCAAPPRRMTGAA
jgi:hypothetical protein